MTKLNGKKQLRSIGHHLKGALKPLVTIAGGGLSENVMAEIDRALHDHELIKVKVAIGDRDHRSATIAHFCEEHKAERVQSIGKVVLILRRNSRPNPKTSNLIRFLHEL